jgi:hypothetical protein
MAVINPLSKENAAASVHGLYDAFAQKFGFMPNIFAAMAYRPEALSSFVPFFHFDPSRTMVNRRVWEKIE